MFKSVGSEWNSSLEEVHKVLPAVSPMWQTGLKKLLLQGGDGWSGQTPGWGQFSPQSLQSAQLQWQAELAGGEEGKGGDGNFPGQSY